MRALACVLILFFSSCSTLNWHDSLESLPAQHSVVVGRVRVQFRGVEATSSCKIGFRGDGPSYRLDETGRVAFRLPEGPNEISSVACLRASNTEHWRFLRPGELVIEVAPAPGVTYFGDVVLYWQQAASYDDPARAVSSLGAWTAGDGNFLEALSGGDPIAVEVARAQTHDLEARLGYRAEIVIRPLRVAPHLVSAPRGARVP